MALGSVTRFIVYGNPNNDVKKALEGVGAVYMPTIGGFLVQPESSAGILQPEWLSGFFHHSRGSLFRGQFYNEA
jgi:hypothetical protein